MEKKELPKEAMQENACPAEDEKWMTPWKKRQQHISVNADKEIANMNHSDFSLFLQEIEHH